MTGVKGVAQDLGTAHSQAIDETGQPVAKLYRLGLEDVSELEARVLAKAARVNHMDQVADRIDSLLGTKTTARFIDRHPLLTGVGAGIGLTGVGYGVFLLGRKIYRSRQLSKMSGSKVVALPRR